MTELLQRHLPALLAWGSAVSLLTLAAVLLAVPWVIERLPADYFHHSRRHPLREHRHALDWLLATLKNLLGVALVVLGVVMLFTPGQGLLTILAGLLLSNFPGKYRLERTLVARGNVLKSLNWMRRRRGQPPFIDPGDKLED